MSDLSVNVKWQEIIAETKAMNIPHCRAIAVKSAYHQEIIETLAGLLLGSYRPTHPDLLIIGTTDKAPPIGDPDTPKGYEGSCRWLIDNIIMKPLESSRKLGVIMCADNLNKNAANSLLKLAEEPPEHVILLFLMEDGRLFLPTLRSRSRFTTITLQEKHESLPVPKSPAEWVKWLGDSRKGLDADGMVSMLEAWANFAAEGGDFELAERIDTLRVIAEKKNLSVAMMCDMIILMLGDDYTKYDYILDDIR